MTEKILLVGGGGHCKSVLDSLLMQSIFSEIAIIDKEENIGKKILGIPIIASDDGLLKLYDSGFRNAFVTLGSIGNPSRRVKIFEMLKEIGYTIPNIIDPSALVSPYAKLSDGVFVGKNSIINAGVEILRGAIVNTGVILEHDCMVGEFAHIAPGSVLCGGVNIGQSTHIGAGSMVKQNITIGSNSMIGIGSVVLRDCGDHSISFGNPCKESNI